MKKLKHLLPLLIALLINSGIISPVQAQNISPVVTSAPVPHVTTTSDCFALSNEATGDLISHLVTAGYSDFNLYDTLLAIQTSTDPSVAGIITDSYLQALQSTPATNEIFTTHLSFIDTPGNIVEICDNGTVQTVPVYGFLYYDDGYPTLGSDISGVGRALFTHASDSNEYLTTWNVTDNGVTITYRVFGVAWMVGQPPFSIYLPWAVKSS